MKRISLHSALSVFLLYALPSFAQQYEAREFYTGARMLAMGGAGIAVVNDETALLVNPAGLGKLRDSFGTIIDPEFDFSANLAGMALKSSIKSPFEPAGVEAALLDNPEKYYHGKLQLFPSYVVRNFGIGIYANYLLNARTNADGTEMQTYYRSDLALLLGYNFRMWGGRIKLGFTGKFINRIEIDKALIPGGDLTIANNASEGAGIGADVGLNLAAPWAWLPTVSAVVRDVGGTKFESGAGLRMSSATRPAKVEQDIDVAFALFPIHANRARSSFTIEQKSLTASSKSENKMKYLHAGYEFNYGDLIFLRAGLNQNYWTAGVEFATEHMQLQLSSYGEEVGPDTAPEENRRVVFKFAFRF